MFFSAAQGMSIERAIDVSHKKISSERIACQTNTQRNSKDVTTLAITLYGTAGAYRSLYGEPAATQ